MIKLNGVMLMKKLSRGFHNEVWAVDGSLVAKVFELGDQRARRELLVLERVASTGLMPAPMEVRASDDWEYELLIMERLRPREVRGFDADERERVLVEFEAGLRAMHDLGVAHGDIRRTCEVGGEWDNVMWNESIRLIDAGSAVFVDEPLFEATVKQDLEDLGFLRAWAVQQ